MQSVLLTEHYYNDILKHIIPIETLGKYSNVVKSQGEFVRAKWWKLRRMRGILLESSLPGDDFLQGNRKAGFYIWKK